MQQKKPIPAMKNKVQSGNPLEARAAQARARTRGHSRKATKDVKEFERIRKYVHLSEVGMNVDHQVPFQNATINS